MNKKLVKIKNTAISLILAVSLMFGYCLPSLAYASELEDISASASSDPISEFQTDLDRNQEPELTVENEENENTKEEINNSVLEDNNEVVQDEGTINESSFPDDEAVSDFNSPSLLSDTVYWEINFEFNYSSSAVSKKNGSNSYTIQLKNGADISIVIFPEWGHGYFNLPDGEIPTSDQLEDEKNYFEISAKCYLEGYYYDITPYYKDVTIDEDTRTVTYVYQFRPIYQLKYDVDYAGLYSNEYTGGGVINFNNSSYPFFMILAAKPDTTDLNTDYLVNYTDTTSSAIESDVQNLLNNCDLTLYCANYSGSLNFEVASVIPRPILNGDVGTIFVVINASPLVNYRICHVFNCPDNSDLTYSDLSDEQSYSYGDRVGIIMPLYSYAENSGIYDSKIKLEPTENDYKKYIDNYSFDTKQKYIKPIIRYESEFESFDPFYKGTIYLCYTEDEDGPEVPEINKPDLIPSTGSSLSAPSYPVDYTDNQVYELYDFISDRGLLNDNSIDTLALTGDETPLAFLFILCGVIGCLAFVAYRRIE